MDVTISVTDIVLSNIEHQIPERSVIPLLEIEESGAELISVKIPPDSGIEGKRLDEMQLPDGALITLVIGKNGAARVPAPDIILSEADNIIALSPENETEALRSIFTGEPSTDSND